jgi:integrase/recombinase XerC
MNSPIEAPTQVGADSPASRTGRPAVSPPKRSNRRSTVPGHPQQSPMSPEWEAMWNRYERAHASQAESTRANVRGTCLSLCRWLQAEGSPIADPAEITRTELREYISAMEAQREGVGVLNCFAELSVFFRWLAGENGCDECAQPEVYPRHSCRLNALHGVRRPSGAKHRTKVVPILSADELAEILAALSGKSFLQVRDKALVLLLVQSGIRRAEAADLLVSDIDLSRRDGAIVHVRDGKNHSDRHAVVGPEAAVAIDKLLSRHPCNPKNSLDSRGGLGAGRAGGAGAGTGRVGMSETGKTVLAEVKAGRATPTDTWDGPLFSKSNGRPLTPQSIGVILRRAGNAAGVELRPHMLRHGWADASYRNGVPTAIMMSLGGWHGSIPQTYGAAHAAERAVTYGLANPVMGKR